MKWGMVLAGIWLLACRGEGAGDAAPSEGCTPACADGLACRDGACTAPAVACATNTDCAGDRTCDRTRSVCVPWGDGASDATCLGAPSPGTFFPSVQCAWAGPGAGDAFPDHVNVLATPMVAAFDRGGAPSLVFTSYNATDYGPFACNGASAKAFGVIRVIDGQTCAPQATIAAPTVVGSAPVAIGDLAGDATPEIVAARSGGGLVAFTRKATGWEVLWQTQPPYPQTPCDWAGPAIHDLDDDGAPEVIFYGAVYNGQTGAAIDTTSAAPRADATAVGYISVVADLDGDGVPELATGTQLYAWDKMRRQWTPERGLAAAAGQVAVGDFGTYPPNGGHADRTQTDGIAETVVIIDGVVRVFARDGSLVFKAQLTGAGSGGPPVVADFDGDGRLEIGTAGADAYYVFDPDCGQAPDPATCAAMSNTGILWSVPVDGAGAELTGSSAFDFDGDGRAEVAHGDRCFARIFDGKTGQVLASRARSSCTWYENPVIADTTGGDAAALVVTSTRTACGAVCPAVDPLFDGVACVDDTDCPSQRHDLPPAEMPCVRDLPGDALGRCRCQVDADCGDGYTCADPRAGATPAGAVCRASHTGAPTTGLQVLADAAHRWSTARPIWNQHAYSVTNIDDAGRVPRTSEWSRNWTTPGLNNFRQNSHAVAAVTGARPDLTVKQAKVTCDDPAPTITAEVCNRGTARAGRGLPVAVYAATTPTRLRCRTQTAAPLPPGACATVSCAWNGPPGDGTIAVDDPGTGVGVARECREDNNLLAIRVACSTTTPR